MFPELRAIFVERGEENSPLLQPLLSRASRELRLRRFRSFERLTQRLSSLSIPEGKKVWVVARNRGQFLRPCPGTRRYLCCGYQTLYWACGCPLDCSYCILQSYFHQPFLLIFSNVEDIFRELEQVFTRGLSRPLRLGTGEFTDSLALEPYFPLSQMLIPFVLRWQNLFLELKTKTSFIEPLLNIDHQRRIFLSWSLNAPRIIEGEERGVASLEQRLAAARLAAQHGFPVGFHFDPLVLYPGCEQEYAEVVAQLFSAVAPQDVVWISLGSVRFPPSLQEVLSRRFPTHKIFLAEFIKGLDGKLRYFKPLRVQLYRQLVEQIRAFASDVTLYLCMESPEVWEKVLGWRPRNNHEVAQLLDNAALRLAN